MKKKGISPLIATVLILGFTVALAAIIMTWGTGFTKRMQEQTEETAGMQVTCATDVVFDIKSACKTATGPYKVTIANNGNIKIDSFIIRYYKAADDVTQETRLFGTGADTGIDKFGIESDSSTTAGLTDVKMVEAIPVITSGGKPVTCAQNIDSFGSLEGAALLACEAT